MLFYVVAFGVLAHILFWGAGLALLTMPRPWRAYWPILAAPAGCALQSLVVWAGAYADLPGTGSYAWVSEAIPCALLAAGWLRRGRFAVRDVRRFAGLGLLCAGVVQFLVTPLAQASKGLTTASLGSCDAADYAAGARVLMEFAHRDRTGFLGLTEVVRVLSVDNFFDFWLRLNHFTPSALIAFNGTIFHCAPHELTGLMAVILLAASVPVVFWVARALLGYRAGVSLAIAAIYGLSPITWYAVYNVAIGQLIAAPGIALITWAGVARWRGAAVPRRRWAFFGVLTIGYALILGSYNFIVIFCLVPAVAYAASGAIRTGRWRQFGGWLAEVLLPLVLTGLVFWARVAGLAERFHQFAAYDFGWPIPVLLPEGWLGWIRSTGLAPVAEPYRLILVFLVVGLLAIALRRGARRGRPEPFIAICLLVPVLLGYAYLSWRGYRLRTNASYDAYKLLAVFYPGILAAACYWVTLAGQWRGWRRVLLRVFAFGLALGLVHSVNEFRRAMRVPPLIVDRDLIQVGRIEAMAQVDSLNMRLGYPDDMWSRLWANEFLLHKPQYFLTYTYEGRFNAPLRGGWDLDGGLIAVQLPPGDSVRINSAYSLVRINSPDYFRAEMGPGWYPMERLPQSATHWQWTAGVAALELTNPPSRALRVGSAFDISSPDDRELQLWVAGRLVGRVAVNAQRGVRTLPEFVLPPGTTTVELRSNGAPSAIYGDVRPLNFCVFGLQLTAQPQPDTL
jgi:hypothetical protein